MGFILDAAGGVQTQSTWVEGEPIKSFWSGVKLKNQHQYPVTTYRCELCGFLESYSISAGDTLLRASETHPTDDTDNLLRGSDSATVEE